MGSTRAKQGMDSLEVMRRVFAMIEHAHRKHRVKRDRISGQVLDRQGQNIIGDIAREMPAGQPLHNEQQRWVYPNYQRCARTQHAQAEITIAAANIQHTVHRKPDVCLDSLPFPVRAPLGFDSQPPQAQGPFAPRVQFHQGFA